MTATAPDVHLDGLGGWFRRGAHSPVGGGCRGRRSADQDAALPPGPARFSGGFAARRAIAGASRSWMDSPAASRQAIQPTPHCSRLGQDPNCSEAAVERDPSFWLSPAPGDALANSRKIQTGGQIPVRLWSSNLKDFTSPKGPKTKPRGPDLLISREISVQGYLAHKKTRPPRTLP